VAFTYLKVKSASAFVYFQWPWFRYFGLGLSCARIKNLVLFTSLVKIIHHTDETTVAKLTTKFLPKNIKQKPGRQKKNLKQVAKKSRGQSPRQLD